MYKHTYRIYTESTEEYDGRTVAIVAGHFESFTVTHGSGYWEGKAEDTIIIEIITGRDHAAAVAEIAKGIRFANNQEAVLVTSTKTYVTMV